MTCKIVQLVERDQLVLLHISGHLQEVHVSMIEELITQETVPVVLDLAEVTIVAGEAFGSGALMSNPTKLIYPSKAFYVD